jgi:hypothetical protein
VTFFPGLVLVKKLFIFAFPYAYTIKASIQFHGKINNSKQAHPFVMTSWKNCEMISFY